MKKLSFIPLLIFLMVNIQCGGGGGDRSHSGTTPVSIKVTELTQGTGSGADQLSAAAKKTGDMASAVEQGEGEGRQLSLCRISITGPGMSDMVREMDIAGKSSIRETFDVPSGVNRSFLVQMFIENNDTVIIQAKSEGHNLEGEQMEILMEPTIQADYYDPPEFSGIFSVSNSETRSVMLDWKPATDNITDQKRMQYLIYLTTQSKRDQNVNDIFEAYELGTGTIRDEDPLMSYYYIDDELFISYEYEGAIPEDVNPLSEKESPQTSTDRLKTGVPYFFLVRAMDEWGHKEDNLVESEQIVVYMLDVEVQGQGSGTVTSDPKGIDCGAKCSEDFLAKKDVTLRAEADDGAEFDGWTENDQCEGIGVCVLTLSNNESITAKFCNQTRYYHDADGDGYGGPETYIDSCTEPDQDNYVENDEDCDDSNPAINPSANEICGNDVDENCDENAEKDCVCNDGDTRPCGTDTGECVAGVESCTVNREWSGVCDDQIGPADEICDGLDNDCDGQIDEGLSRQTTCGEGECAGNTGEETCTKGVWGNDTCDPMAGAGVEVCDGLDNDCNSSTADGSDESWYDTDCDGDDTDFCKEGQWECTNGSKTCSDSTGNTKDICDGKDNDCNSATADGSGESWIGDNCDGDDTDKCKEGQYQCTNGSQTCSDNSGSTKDTCDGKDNDCNSSTADGSDESWYDTDCDGDDTDFCKEGQWECTKGSKTCSDKTRNDVEICTDNKDNDCDGLTDYDDTADCFEVGCGGKGEYCGEQSPDGCWCDEECVYQENCCSDINPYYDKCLNIVGTWDLIYDFDCDQSTSDTKWYINDDGTFSDSAGGSGNWTVRSNTVTLTYTSYESNNIYKGTVYDNYGMAGNIYDSGGSYRGCWDAGR